MAYRDHRCGPSVTFHCGCLRKLPSFCTLCRSFSGNPRPIWSHHPLRRGAHEGFCRACDDDRHSIELGGRRGGGQIPVRAHSSGSFSRTPIYNMRCFTLTAELRRKLGIAVNRPSGFRHGHSIDHCMRFRTVSSPSTRVENRSFFNGIRSAIMVSTI